LETVRSALKAAFGSVRIQAIEPIGGGASGAFPFRVDIAGRRHVVRIEGPRSPLRNPHQYESMRVAAEAGIAPRIYYLDDAAGLAVMDYIEEKSLSAFPGGPHALAKAIGETLGRLQTTPPFQPFVEYPEMVGCLWRWVCQTGLFATGVLDPYTERFERIRQIYVWDPANSVSSHNDLVPRNVLFDGTRLWLIDWESAYRNDPLADVAIALDNFAPSSDLEQILTEAWLGQKPDGSLLARLEYVRALTRLYYAGVFLSASAAVFGPMRDPDSTAPTVESFRRAIRTGEIRPGSPKAKHILGKMYLASFMTGEIPPGLSAAV
jgi:aminoglycoside phosphotransferase (APT) family kinase protein